MVILPILFSKCQSEYLRANTRHKISSTSAIIFLSYKNLQRRLCLIQPNKKNKFKLHLFFFRHIWCVAPPLHYVPADDWFCPKCLHARLVLRLTFAYVQLDESIREREEAERRRLAAEEARARVTRMSTRRRPGNGIDLSNIIFQKVGHRQQKAIVRQATKCAVSFEIARRS